MLKFNNRPRAALSALMASVVTLGAVYTAPVAHADDLDLKSQSSYVEFAQSNKVYETNSGDIAQYGADFKNGTQFVDFDPDVGIDEITDEGVFIWTLYRDVLTGSGSVASTGTVAKVIIRNDYTAPLVYIAKSGNYLRLVSTDMLSGVDKLQIDDRVLKYRDDTAIWDSIDGKNLTWDLVGVEGGTKAERDQALLDGIPSGAIGLIFTFEETADHKVNVTDVAGNLTYFTIHVEGTGGGDDGSSDESSDSSSESSSEDSSEESSKPSSSTGDSDISGDAGDGDTGNSSNSWPDYSHDSNDNSGSNTDGDSGDSGDGNSHIDLPGFSITVKDGGTSTVDPDGSHHGQGNDNNWKGPNFDDDNDGDGDGNGNGDGSGDPSTNGDINWPGDPNGSGNGNGSDNGNGSGNGDGDGTIDSGWNTPGIPDYSLDTGNGNGGNGAGNGSGDGTGNGSGAVGDIGGPMQGNVASGNSGGHHVSCRSLDCDGSCLSRHLYRCVDPECTGMCKTYAVIFIVVEIALLAAVWVLGIAVKLGKIRLPAAVVLVLCAVFGIAGVIGSLAFFRYAMVVAAVVAVVAILSATVLFLVIRRSNKSHSTTHELTDDIMDDDDPDMTL